MTWSFGHFGSQFNWESNVYVMIDELSQKWHYQKGKSWKWQYQHWEKLLKKRLMLKGIDKIKLTMRGAIEEEIDAK